MLYLQRSRATSDGHHLHCVFTYYKNFADILFQREYTVVFKENNSFGADFAGCGIMFGASEAAFPIGRSH